MTFLFLRRSLERFVEESETNCYHFPSNKKKREGEKQEIEERQAQREHSTINVKYPLWNIPVASTAEDEYKIGLYRSKFSALGPPLIPFLFPNSTSPAYGFLVHVLDVYEAFKRPQHNSHNHGQRAIRRARANRIDRPVEEQRDQAAVTAKSEVRLCASGYVLLRENIMHVYAGRASGLSRWGRG